MTMKYYTIMIWGGGCLGDMDTMLVIYSQCATTQYCLLLYGWFTVFPQPVKA